MTFESPSNHLRMTIGTVRVPTINFDKSVSSDSWIFKDEILKSVCFDSKAKRNR
jgi:hypothetical protein